MNMDFNENVCYQEGIIPEMYQRHNRSYLQEAPEMDSLLDPGKLVQNSYLTRLTWTKY